MRQHLIIFRNQFLRAGLSVLLLLIAFSPAASFAQYKCAQEIVEAEKIYREGRYGEAERMINICLAKTGLSKTDSVQAFLLLAKVHLSQAQRDRAEASLRIVLRLSPEWRPDVSTDRPSFRNFAENVITKVENERKSQAPKVPEQKQEPLQVKKPGGKGKAWLWIGLGTVALGGGVAILAGGKGGEPTITPTNERLPNPPGTPSGN